MWIIDKIKSAVTYKAKKEVKEPLKVTVTRIDIKNLPKDTQDWIRRCYNKKNGIKS